MADKAQKLYIVDGMAYAFRSFYAIKNLRDSKGRPTNAIFGFARMLLKILREHDPSHIVMVFDAPGKTFRDDLYPAYKANRNETPADLVEQFPRIDRLVRAFDVPILRIPGVEADDVMGALAKRAETQGMETVLVTGDKDILQLVTAHAKVFDPSKGDDGLWYGPEEVKERFGVYPEHVIEVLGLMGDTADNVPGVHGIGEKTARKLLEEYVTIENLYAHLDDLKGKQKERLIEDRDNAFLSRKLVTIITDIDLPGGLEDYRRREPDSAKLAEAFAEFEFQTLHEEFAPKELPEELDYQLVLTREHLDRVVDEMLRATVIAVDTETTSTQPVEAELVGISLSARENTGYYIPVGHAPPDLAHPEEPRPEFSKADAIAALKSVLESSIPGKVGHNIKYDLIVLANAGIELAGIVMDTMVASYLTDPERFRHNLNEVSLQYLRRKMIPISDLIGKGAKAITFDKVPLDDARDYACEDADIALRLYRVFQEPLKAKSLESLFDEVELPLIGVLARMEMAGIAIDAGLFERLRAEIGDRLDALEAEIVEMVPGPFQINSPKQLQKVLFEDLGLPTQKKTKTGYSTDVEVLEELAHLHPLPAKILEYRGLEKLRGTYVEALPKLVNPKTGRIHTSFNQAVAATGRLSSSDPNLQNIPIRTELGKRIREGFVPGDPGHRLISADYSQIELRILAHLSNDEALKEAFRQDMDIHRDTASRVFGVEQKNVTPDMRRQAKAVNFGVVYGISAFGLARNTGVSNAEAARFIDDYFRQYPGVKRWIDDTIAETKEKGFVTTLLNRRRYVPDLAGSDRNAMRAAERVAINTPVQGSAADIIKIAMIRLDRELLGTGARLVLQVHDELLVECPKDQCEHIAGRMRNIMENALQISVPLKVDVGIGNNWAQIH